MHTMKGGVPRTGQDRLVGVEVASGGRCLIGRKQQPREFRMLRTT